MNNNVLKRFVAAVAAAVLALSLLVLVGCGGGGSGAPAKKTPTLGDTITFDKLEITFDSAYSFVKLDNMFSEHDGKDVVRVGVHITNKASENHSLNIFAYKMYGSKGVELDDVSAYFDDEAGWAGDLRPGASYDVALYLLYDGDGTYAIDFGFMKTEVTVEFEVTNPNASPQTAPEPTAPAADSATEASPVKASVDYDSAEALEKALVAGDDVKGKTATVTIRETNPESAFGFNLIAGEHLNFVSGSKDPKVAAGDTVTVRITEVEELLGSWILGYEIV